MSHRRTSSASPKLLISLPEPVHPSVLSREMAGNIQPGAQAKNLEAILDTTSAHLPDPLIPHPDSLALSHSCTNPLIYVKIAHSVMLYENWVIQWWTRWIRSFLELIASHKPQHHIFIERISNMHTWTLYKTEELYNFIFSIGSCQVSIEVECRGWGHLFKVGIIWSVDTCYTPMHPLS